MVLFNGRAGRPGRRVQKKPNSLDKSTLARAKTGGPGFSKNYFNGLRVDHVRTATIASVKNDGPRF